MNHHESGATPRVGMIGLGKMGRPMARRLAVGGQHVVLTSTRGKQQVLTDLTADSSLSTSSFEWADSAAQLAATCHEIVLMLPDLPQIINYLEAPDGLLTGLERRPANSPPLLLIIGATCSAVGVKNLASELEGRFGGRVVLVDAPVSGGEDGAIQGTLSIMLGGDHDACVRARGVLALCGTPVRLGELGAGQVAKACNQLVVGATMFALGEASVLAERSGLDLAAMWELLSGGYASSRLLDTRRERLVSGDDSPSGAIKYLLKDLQGVQEIADETTTRVALLPTLLDAVAEVIDAGLGERDLAVTKRFIAGR